MNFALPAAVWVVLSWRGGLYPWQQAVAALLLAALLWRERSRLPSWSGLGAVERALVLLLLAAGCGVAVSLRPQVTLNAVAGLGLSLAAAMVIRRQSRDLAAHVATLLMAGGAAFSAAFLTWGLVSWSFNLGLADSVTAARWFFPNQNLLAAGLALPALLLGLTSLAASTPPRRKILAGLCVGLGALALVYAGSRGAYFALGAAFLWILSRWPGAKKRIAVWIAVVLLSVSAMALWAPFSRLASRMKLQAKPGFQDVNYYRRTDFWLGAAKLSLQRPLLGYGLGSFGAAAYRLDLPTPLTPQEPIARYRLSLDHAHNEWLELAVEIGWVATLILALCALSWKRRRWRSGRCDPEILGLEAVVIAAGALSLVDMNLRTPALAWGLILCFCAIEAKPQGDSSTAGVDGSGPAKLALCVAAALAVFCLLGAAMGNGFKRHHGEGRAGEIQALAAISLQPLDSGLSAADWDVPQWPWAAWAGRQDPAWWWTEGARSEDPAVQESDGRHAVALMPYFAPLRYMLGLRLAQDGNSAEAAQDMAQALSLEPNFCSVLAWQADQALARGDKAGAQKLVNRVLAARALKADSPDGYTAYIQSVDPAWLASHVKKTL